jgi:tRNA G46 methylase TrmB
MEIIKKQKKEKSIKDRFIQLKPEKQLKLSTDLETYARWLATTLKNQTGNHYKVNRKENHILVTRL